MKFNKILYGNFDVYSSAPSLDYHAPNITFSEKVFENYLAEVPENGLIIEVGSLYGNSAINMAKILEKLNRSSVEIVCIDTWLGSVEHMPGGRFHTVKEVCDITEQCWWNQFRSNVIKSGFTHIITPFRQTSVNASKVLTSLGVKADLIYLDASHEKGDVLNDINAFFPLLKDNGKMIGDDYYWDGVHHDVNLFINSNKHDFDIMQVDDSKFNSPLWVIHKNQTASIIKRFKNKLLTFIRNIT